MGSTRLGQQAYTSRNRSVCASSPPFFPPLSHPPLFFILSAAITTSTAALRCMDHTSLIRNIFSRNTSPPIQSYPEDQSPSTQHFPQFRHVSPAQSIKDVPPSSPPTHVESLFSNLTNSGQSSVNLQGTVHPMTTTTAAAATASGPTSPASSITALSAPTNMTTSTNTPPNANPASDTRQSALLSLLSSVSPTGSSSSAPQQVPTPPGPSGPANRTGPTTAVNNESQGRFLLEQLMAG